MNWDLATAPRVCRDCGKDFVLSHGEVEFYVQRELSLPRRCERCRRARKGTAGDGASREGRADGRGVTHEG